jgi:hypothetical protein
VIDRAPYPILLSDAERALGVWRVTGDEVTDTDVLVFLGEPYRIEALASGTDALTFEPGTRVALVDGQEFIWVRPSQWYRILPRPTEGP